MRPTSCPAATSSTARSILNTLARGARHLDRSADKAPPGLPRIAAWSGVIAAALVVQGGPARLQSRRGRPDRARSALVASRRWRPGQPLAGRAARAGRDARPAARRLYRRPPRRARRRSPRRSPRAVARLLAVDAGRRGAVELAGRQHGEPAAGSLAAVEGSGVDAGRCARRAAGAISGSPAKTACSCSTPRRRRRRARSPAAAPRRSRSSSATGRDRLVVNCGGVGESPGALPRRARSRRCAPPPPIRR